MANSFTVEESHLWLMICLSMQELGLNGRMMPWDLLVTLDVLKSRTTISILASIWLS